MPQKRQFYRIEIVVEATLHCHDGSYRCRIENLCPTGALVSAREIITTLIHPGYGCLLQMDDDAGQPMAIQASVAHHGFAFIGLAFRNLAPEVTAALEKLLQQPKPVGLPCARQPAPAGGAII